MSRGADGAEEQGSIGNCQLSIINCQLLIVILFLFLISFGYWQATAVGPQVQVPMFYDAHYLYPRPWTQAQAAPGVPEPAPVAALYGPNRVSQSFVAGSDRLAVVGVWLAGTEGTAVDVSLLADDGPTDDGPAGNGPAGNGPAGNGPAGNSRPYRGIIHLTGSVGRRYYLSLPAITDARGRRFTLSLTAPAATVEQPVLVRAVGGDRLGGSIHLNEYSRPGNLELYTYAAGLPGRWWLDATAEQLLPSLFRLRLQQYKPALFKGAAFSLLLVVTMALTAVFLVGARPSARPWTVTAGWWLVVALVLFLVWQLGSGRLLLPGLIRPLRLDPHPSPLTLAPAAGSGRRLAHDLSLTLWTAERYPEARFITTDWYEAVPAIRVPAESALVYHLVVPPGGRLRSGLAVDGEGELQFEVGWPGWTMAAERITAVDGVIWLDLDLAALAGQGGALSLVAQPVRGTPDGLWLMPQISTTADWLYPDPLPLTAVQPVTYRFSQTVELVGSTLAAEAESEALRITLYWRVLRPTDAHPTVFLHLLDENGDMQAQQDGPPVLGSYPVAAWQPGTIVADERTLFLPAGLVDGRYQLALGLYDPVTRARWPSYDERGEMLPDGRAILPLTLDAGRWTMGVQP
jgi:hypothetical protein